MPMNARVNVSDHFLRVAPRLRALVPMILFGLGFAATPATEAQEPHRRLGGANVRVLPHGGGDVRGELIGLDAERVWVLGRDSILRSVSREDVRGVRVQRNAHSATQLRRWTAAGASTTGLGMLIACNSVDDAEGCAVFALVWGFAWALVGGVTTLLAHPTLEVPAAGLDSVAAYARFPQGVPEGYAPGVPVAGGP